MLSNTELWSGTLASNARRRRAVALLVAHLAEVERRQLHLREGYSSLYDFCLRGLGMSEGEAHRSISSARVARRFPIAVGMLADGRLHLTGLSLLANRLTESNHAELLEEACGKTKADIQVVLARRFPRPDVPDRIELLDAGDWCRGSNEEATNPATGSEHCGDVQAGARSAGGAPATAAPGLFECVGRDSAGSRDCRTREQMTGDPVGTEFRDRIEARSAERFAIRFSASAAFRAKLEHARNLMSHVGRGLETVFERALDLLIAERENKCWGKTDRPRSSSGAKHGAPTRQSKREVYERDAGQCTYVSPAGVHCTARAFLNFDHIKERANGGGGAADNGQLLCAAHNQMRARQTFGDAFMDDKIARRRRKTRSSVAVAKEGAASPAGTRQQSSRTSDNVDHGEDAAAERVRQRRSPALDLEGGRAARAECIRQRGAPASDLAGGNDTNGGSVRQRRSPALDLEGGGAASVECIRQRRSSALDCEGREDAAAACFRQRRSQATNMTNLPVPTSNSTVMRAQVLSAAAQVKLVSALTAMGFRKSECRKAVVELVSCGHAGTMDQLIRRALALLVPG
ncbi:MAG: RuvA C-terminal domain-containing protein [Polyangiaceae bacterium]